MRLYIVRHADPDYENNTITPSGHLEAKALAKRMASHELDRIYTSPYGRAMHTMKYTADALNMGCGIEYWTREMWPELWLKDTPWGVVASFEAPGEAYRSGDRLPTHDTWHNHELLKNSIIQEAFEKMKSSSDEFLKRHGYERRGGLYRCIEPNQEQIAVFCHAGFGLTWLAHLLEIPLTLMWSGFFIAPSSVTTILFEERSKEWAVPRCIGMGDVSHLYEAGLPVGTRGLQGNFY